MIGKTQQTKPAISGRVMIELLDHRLLEMAAQIHRLQQASYAVERDLIEYADFPPLSVSIDDIQQEAAQFLGYRQGRRLMGVVSFAGEDARLHITRMIVHPRYFRRGIASALLCAVEDFALFAQAVSVSTAVKNVPAIRLYEKHGYRQRQRTVLPDGLVLVRLCKKAG